MEFVPTKALLIGQRVIVGDEIGTVQRAIKDVQIEKKGYVWVHLPSKGYASHFAEHNVKPLPDGQL